MRPDTKPSLPGLFRSFAKIGAFTFGGGYAMIPLIRAELVSSRRWLADEDFGDILCLAQMAPGILAVNTALLTGFRLRGLRGALVACLGAILPSFLIILLIASTYGRFHDLPLVERIFRGMRPAVVGLIAAAVATMGRSMLRGWRAWAMAAAVFALAVLAKLHPVLLLLLAGTAGILFPVLSGRNGSCPDGIDGRRGSVSWGLLLSLSGAFFTIGALTFGGGYAMLTLLERIIISGRQWLTAAQFLDIVAIAEMTPGPIAINAATFVGYRLGGLAGSAAATIGVVLPSAIVVPSLAALFYRHRELPAIQRAIGGIRSAVIALIAAAVISVGRASILTWRDAAVAGAVLAVMLKTKVHPVLVLLGAALVQYVGGLLW